MDDADVVASFLGGEERAFQELVSRYQTRLLNFIYRTISDREKAEDLVQEVFIRVYRHIGRFDRSKKFSTWIYTIASNLAKNELRNRSRNPLVLFQSIKKTSQEDDRPAAVRGQLEPSGRPLPQAPPARAGRGERGQAAGAPPRGVRAARARGEELRGDRRDHEDQPRHGEVAPQPGAHELRGPHRAEAALTPAPARRRRRDRAVTAHRRGRPSPGPPAVRSGCARARAGTPFGWAPPRAGTPERATGYRSAFVTRHP
jgi:RNA polymerase sigma factor (sigma-70 family)